MLQPERHSKVIQEAGMGRTQHLCRFPFSVNLPRPVYVWDTFGLARERYTDDEITLLLDGRLPIFWGISATVDEFPEQFEKQKDRDGRETQIHAVIFFLPQSVLTDPRDPEGEEELKRTFQLIQRKKYSPVIMISRADEVCKQLRSSPLEIHCEVERLRRSAANMFDVSLSDVRYTVNYLDETERQFGIDTLAYENIKYVLDKCHCFAKTLREQVCARTLLVYSQACGVPLSVAVHLHRRKVLDAPALFIITTDLIPTLMTRQVKVYVRS